MSDSQLEQLPFSEFTSQFILERESRNLSLKTVSLYKLELKYFLEWLSNKGVTEIINLTPPILRNWFSDLGTHRNRGGVYNNFKIVKTFLRWFNEEYEPENFKNPINKVKISPNNNQPLPEIPLEVIQAMLKVSTGRNSIRDKALLKFFVDTGCRASELVALNLEDVDLSSGKVVIRHGKGDKFRIVFIGNGTKKALGEYLRNRDSAISALWLTDENTRLKFCGLRQIVIRLCNKAGGKVYPLHSFRRTFALTLWRKGIDILTISRLLGHTSIEITKRYLNINNEDLREAHSRASPADSLE